MSWHEGPYNVSMMLGNPENIENQKTRSSFILIQTAFAGYPHFLANPHNVRYNSWTTNGSSSICQGARPRGAAEMGEIFQHWWSGICWQNVAKNVGKLWATYGRSLDDSYWDCCVFIFASGMGEAWLFDSQSWFSSCLLCFCFPQIKRAASAIHPFLRVRGDFPFPS